MRPIAENVRAVQSRIENACARAKRPPDSVHLVAAAKTFPPESIRAAFAAGCRRIGENYLQEAKEKMAALADLPIEWHFVGVPQTRKAAAVARMFAWAHGVDNLRAAEKMSAAREECGKAAMNVFLQVNLAREPSKGGAAPEDAPAIAAEIAKLPRLRLRGLTVIPPPTPDSSARRRAFRAAAKLRDAIAPTLSTPALSAEFADLSMGMSADLEDAILEGATFVRLGEAIFGRREKRQ